MQNNKGAKLFSRVGRIFIGITLAAMVLMVFVNAFARYVFTYNFPVFEELSRYLFVWVAFLGAILAYFEGKHVGIDMLVSRLHGIPQIIVKMIAKAGVFLCQIVMGIGGYQYFMLTATDPSPSAKIPFGVISGMAIVLVVFMVGITIRDTIREVKDFSANAKEKQGKREE